MATRRDKISGIMTLSISNWSKIDPKCGRFPDRVRRQPDAS